MGTGDSTTTTTTTTNFATAATTNNTSTSTTDTTTSTTHTAAAARTTATNLACPSLLPVVAAYLLVLCVLFVHQQIVPHILAQSSAHESCLGTL